MGGAHRLQLTGCVNLHRGTQPNAVSELRFVRSVAPTDRNSLPLKLAEDASSASRTEIPERAEMNSTSADASDCLSSSVFPTAASWQTA